jgi:Cys-tRNA(Pro) deacylase
MTRPTAPSTPAVRLLRARGVAFTPRLYRYEERGGTRVAARELAVEEHEVIKTLVMEDERQRPLLVLMHGDREVATGRLARAVGCKEVRPCEPDAARRHTGCLVGGTSPFATRKPMPVYMERSILALPRVLINGGSRGFLVEMAPAEAIRVLSPVLVDVAVELSRPGPQITPARPGAGIVE